MVDVFSLRIGCNVEDYADNMIVKTAKGCIHAANLKDVIQLVKKYNMHLNLAKCSSGVHVGKLLGYRLTKKDIKVNPDKCHTVINMRSPINIK